MYQIGKWFLMMALRLGNKDSYCVIKLHEVENVVLRNSGTLHLL